MNPLYAVGFILLGVISIIIVLLVITWAVNRQKRLPPRYIRETQRWLWLMNKKPLVIWNERSAHHSFKWKDWDMGTAQFYSSKQIRKPEPGDIIIVDGRYNKRYIFVVTNNDNNNIESCYLGFQYEQK